MTTRYQRAAVVWLALLVVMGPAAAAEPPLLTLEEAERTALSRDPVIAGYRNDVLAREQAALAAGQLPDPTLITEAMSMPLDGRFGDLPMTEFRLGLRQTFPRGDTRRLRQSREAVLADGERARVQDAERRTLQGVRSAWIDLHAQRQALALMYQTGRLLEDLAHVTGKEFASGTVSRQEWLRIELEQERLEDRISATRIQEAQALANLNRWLSDREVQWSLPDEVPKLPEPASNEVDGHPLLVLDEAEVDASRHALTLARQGYRPRWSVQVSYGKSPATAGIGDDRRISAMLALDVPLYTRGRVDSEVAEQIHRRDARLDARRERERTLRATLAATHARWLQLAERENRFETRLLAYAAENVESAEEAYRAGARDFTALIRARLGLLETRLDALRITTDRRLAQVELLYLLGEDNQ